MKRIAWLLLALSLPAWATINGVDSSRVVFPSWDGTRYAQYLVGDLPNPTPDYVNDFEACTPGSTTFGIADEYPSPGVLFQAPNSESAQTCSVDPLDAGNQSYHVRVDVGPDGYVEWPAHPAKHRYQHTIANNLTNDISGSHTTGQTRLRFVPDGEYWFGFRMHVDVESSPAYNRNSWNWFVFGFISATVGGPEFYLTMNNTSSFNIHSELVRYKDESGVTQSPHKVKFSNITQREWHEVVVHLIAKPYSLGTYIDGVTGQSNPGGVAQMWLDGDLVYDYSDQYVGTDRIARGEDNDYLKMGLYNGTQGDTTGQGFINFRYDDFRVYMGADGFAQVDPSP